MATFVVNQANDDGSGNIAGTLSNAIQQANQNPGQDTIDIQTDVTLTGAPTRFIEDDVIIDGNDADGVTEIDGGDAFRPFFIRSGTVEIQDLTITNGLAQGVNSSFGGGGAGLGGGIFIYDGSVTLTNVDFDNNQAIGGSGLSGDGSGNLLPANNGADAAPSIPPASGNNGSDGGFGGNGGNGGRGSGLGGTAANGGNGGNGGFLGNGGFGYGGDGTGFTTIGGYDGDGGDGGSGGFGGGGGGGGYGSSNFGGTIAGDGGDGGDGGFGGGGGPRGTITGPAGSYGSPGNGGFGGGDSGTVGFSSFGGGGAGFGGGIFIRSGTLNLNGVDFNNNTAMGGTGANNGQGLGGAIFALHITEQDNGNNQGFPGSLPTVMIDENSTFTNNNATDTANDGSQEAIDPDPTDDDPLDTDAVFGSTMCFLTGTLITTDQGEVPVEQLKMGDKVKTSEGKFERVKWVGHQTFDRATQRPHPFRTFPICLKAGALGDNLPVRDLYVSPDHAMFFDGLLINAGALTNGTSIIQVEMDRFVWHHIELEQHSLLLAEGTPAESYLPQNQARDTFDNGDEYEELYPNHNILSLLPMHFPRVSSKRQLPRFISKKLMQVAETLPSTKATVTV